MVSSFFSRRDITVFVGMGSPVSASSRAGLASIATRPWLGTPAQAAAEQSCSLCWRPRMSGGCKAQAHACDLPDAARTLGGAVDQYTHCRRPDERHSDPVVPVGDRECRREQRQS
jgi:hypothetical protein